MNFNLNAIANLRAINETVDRYVREGNHKTLIDRIGIEEFRNHVSCIFHTEHCTVALSCWLKTKSIIPDENYILVGFTPSYPISNPSATNEDNKRYYQECKQQLDDRNISYVEAYGQALDFNPSPGCFIVAARTLADLDFVLKDQLSCLAVGANGKTELISLIEEAS